MLRDRMPSTLDIALRWCKAKEKWMDYVYEKHIKTVPKNQRSNAVKITLGTLPAYTIDDIKSVFRDLGKKLVKPIPPQSLRWDFKDTVPNDSYWAYVNSWVSWFRKTFSFIEHNYVINVQLGKSELQKKNDINHFISFLEEPWRTKLNNYLLSEIKRLHKFLV